MDVKNDQHQARAFERLDAESDFTAQQLANITGFSARHCYRIMAGDYPLGFVALRDLLSSRDTRVGDAIADALTAGTGRCVVRLPDGDCATIDVDCAETFSQLADFARQRATDQADGILDRDEKAMEIRLLRVAARNVLALLSAVERQQTGFIRKDRARDLVKANGRVVRSPSRPVTPDGSL